MKVDKINSYDYNIYVYNVYLELDQIEEYVKSLKNRLKLKGFYKVYVCNNKIGCFLRIIRLEDSFYHDTLDLKIKVDNDMEIYFKTEDFFIISNWNRIILFNNNYYGLINDNEIDVISIVEYGSFVFGKLMLDVLNNGILLK